MRLSAPAGETPPTTEGPLSPELDVVRLVKALEQHGVEYVIVGGLAALGYGAERLTNDADCVVRHDRANLDRLGRAMQDLGARLDVEGMTDEQAKLLPVQLDGRTLASMEISTWMTDAGGLDVLADIPAGDGRRVFYEELVGRASLLQGDGVVIRAAALDDIIASKEWTNRAKDREALAELYELRAARSETGG